LSKCIVFNSLCTFVSIYFSNILYNTTQYVYVAGKECTCYVNKSQVTTQTVIQISFLVLKELIIVTKLVR